MAKHPENRAHRRFHRTRVVQNRRRLEWVKSNERWASTLPSDEKFAYLCGLWGVLAKVAKPCSCAMCGNPRRYHGGGSWEARTRQEVVADLKWHDE